jgi:prevent-host-death family protein
MTEIPLRDLRNNTSEVLRRAETGEELTVTISGRPVAKIVPLPRRRAYLTLSEILHNRADPGLREDLQQLTDGETTADLTDPWERYAAQ